MEQSKLDWMKEVGMREFDKPMKYRLGTNHFYSEEYIQNTPLEKLKERHDECLIESYVDGNSHNPNIEGMAANGPNHFLDQSLKR